LPPPGFWDALCGALLLEQADPETCRLVESLYEDGRCTPDPIEEAIRLGDVCPLLPYALCGLPTNGQCEAGCAP